jgi:hypothetical protein
MAAVDMYVELAILTLLVVTINIVFGFIDRRIKSNAGEAD